MFQNHSKPFIEQLVPEVHTWKHKITWETETFEDVQNSTKDTTILLNGKLNIYGPN